MAQNNILSSLAVFDYSNNKLCDLYDSQNNLTGQAYKIIIEMNRDDGVKTLSFQIPYMVDEEENFRWAFLKNEYQIRCIYNGKTEWFIAQKPVKHKEKGAIYGNVTCNGTEITLKKKNIYKEFDDTNGIGTLSELADKVIAGTGWSRGYTDTIYEADGTTEKIRSITSGGKQGALGLISTLCNLFKCYPVYKSDTKEIEFHSRNNHSQVIEGTVGVNLDSLTVQPDSTDIITRLYVEGEYADDGYIGIDNVNPTGLSYIMNFDYYREIGLFKSTHEAALATYLSDATSYKSSISSYANSLAAAENNANNLIGQCDLVVYYAATGFTTPKYVYGEPTAEQKALVQGDSVLVLNNNGTYRAATVPASPSSLIETGDYAIAKFVTGAAGSIGAYEVQIEAKQQEITNLQRKINATTKADKIAEYNAEITALQSEIQTIYTQTNGLYAQMHLLMKSDGYLYDIDCLRGMVATYQEYLDDAESDFIIAMGDMLSDGYWNNHNYIEGQEQHLFDDATDLLKSMSRPEISYTFNLVRLRQEFGIPIENFNLNDIFKIYDKELGVNDNSMYVQKITIGIDDETLGSIEVSNKDIALNSHDLGNLLSRMSQLADLIEQKNSLYDRAKAIAKDNTVYANRLNGQIDVLKNKLVSTVSGWHTDERGNMIFLSADGSGAMMLCGAGFMIASEKDNNGDWVWRTFGTSEGFTADEIVAGFISAERIEAGSINVDKLGPGVGGSLEISSNPSIIESAENIAPPFSESTPYVVDDVVSYQGKVYKFTSDHAAGAWNASHVTRINANSEYYNIISGISILNEGITITGQKYVKIQSGGSLYVDATDFKIDSVNKYMKCGNWEFSDDGTRYTFQSNNDFRIYVGESPEDGGTCPAGLRCGIRVYNPQHQWNDMGIIITDESNGEPYEFRFRQRGPVQGTPGGIDFNAPSIDRNGNDIYSITAGWYCIHATDYFDIGGSTHGTPAIRFQGSYAKSSLIRFIDNDRDQYGNGIAIGDGGLVVIGSGESASAVLNGKTAGDENMYLSADEAIYFYSNVQNGIGSAKSMAFNKLGQIERGTRAQSWYNGRDGAIVRNNNEAASGYNPVVSVKSKNGSWEMGTYTDSDIFYLTYIADSDYNSNNNRYAGQYSFKKLGNGVSKEVSDAITGISRNGLTFTATRMNGGTFTFTQTWRGYQVKSYNCSYTVNSNNFKDITGSNFGVLTPSGYTPVAVCLFNPGNDKCWVSAINVQATGSTPLMTVHNPTGSNFTNTAYISILYVQT